MPKLGSESFAAVIGALVGGAIAAGVGLWSTSETTSVAQSVHVESQGTSFAIARAGMIANAQSEILEAYGDVTTVGRMEPTVWYQLQARAVALGALGAPESQKAAARFYKSVKNRDRILIPDSPERRAFYKERSAMAKVFAVTIDNLLQAPPD